MSASGLEVLDTSVQKTHIWLKEIMEQVKINDRHQAYMALKATLHALRDRLSINEAAQLGAQLPLIIRGLFYEGWRPAAKPDSVVGKEAFIWPVYLAACQGGRFKPEDVVSAVFEVLARHVSGGEIDDVIGQLPPEIRALWPEQARIALR
jgi:uncharacterized protein (DUF2267 family)